MTKLKPGDRVSYLSPSGSGRKLRAVVIPSLEFRGRGEELLVPVQRHFNRKRKLCAADGHGETKTHWKKRSELRKLPN